MGQTLSEPITTKHTSVSSNSFLRVAVSCMQGWRINMEDAHTHLLALPGDPTAAFFAVFDGHGGAAIAQHVSHHLHKKIVAQSHYARGDYDGAMKYGFLQMDKDMYSDIHLRDDPSGTTAVTMLIKNNKIICANVGDSRAIASVDGAIQQLSYDHKPNNEAESRRIVAAGGWVEFNRVNGNLALSRALGDFIFKKNDRKPPEEQIVTACPDVITREITSSHEFIVLACDGIWDVMSNQEVLLFVRTRIAHRIEPSIICEELLNTCLAPDAQMGGLGCDNMTVLLICLLNGGTYESLASRCAKPVRANAASAGSAGPFSTASAQSFRHSAAAANQLRLQSGASKPPTTHSWHSHSKVNSRENALMRPSNRRETFLELPLNTTKPPVNNTFAQLMRVLKMPQGKVRERLLRRWRVKLRKHMAGKSMENAARDQQENEEATGDVPLETHEKLQQKKSDRQPVKSSSGPPKP